MKVEELKSIAIRLASPEEILSWSHGEVTKPETINYRTLRPEKDGLFCERIFGPTIDYQCYCGKYRKIRYKGVICDRCGVEVTKSIVRRERMGHIKLACPVSHIWFLRSVPSSMGQVLDISRTKLERVVYFAAYIVISVSEKAKQKALENIEKEYKIKVKTQKAKIKDKKELDLTLKKLEELRERAVAQLEKIKPLAILSEIEYRDLSLKYGQIFTAKTGAEALYEVFKEIDLKKEIEELKQKIEAMPATGRKNILRRLRFFEAMEKAGIRPEWMFLTILPILPPDLRPMVQLDGGRYASSDLNDLYRRVINRNNRLKYLLEIRAPEVIVRNEKRMLQEAVDALIDNGMRTATMTRATTGGRRLLKSLADMLKGKKGRFRRNLLGKRVDYSGRSAIVVGPELKLSQVGIPKEMALELFKPFVIQKLLKRELAYNVRGASRLIEQKTDEVWAILEEIVKDKFVLLNRAPTLHRLSIQAFQPVLIEGKAISIHPLVCKAFNADFDGDQMAVHLPLSESAQKEAREIMLSTLNLLKPAIGRPIVNPTQDIILGSYWMSKIKEGAKGEGKIFSSPEEALLAYEMGEIDLRARIKICFIKEATKKEKKENMEKDKKGKQKKKNAEPLRPAFNLIETSVGRLIFNRVLPEDFPFQNELLDSKKLEKISWAIIEKYGLEKAPEVLDRIKELGFEYSTRSGLSLCIDDFAVPAQKKNIVKKAEKEIENVESLYAKGLLSDEEKTEKVIEIWTKAKSEIEEALLKTLPKEGAVFAIADSGCRGSWVQPVQMAGMKGLVVNPLGETIELPVKSSFKEGLGVLEYFISTHGARKGTADTALGTSKAGYLTRRLIDVAHEVIVGEEDCGDKKGTIMFLEDAKTIGQDFAFKLVGRTVLEDIKDKKGDVIVSKNEIIDWQKAEQIKEAGLDKVKVRTPLTCQSKRGVCRKCYGWDLGRAKEVNLGEAVGIVAAQAIGEPGTQLTLRTFHSGGVAGGSDITVGLPRVDEVFEVRAPKGQAVISQVDGKVLQIKDRIVRIKVEAGNPSKFKNNSLKSKNGKKQVDIIEYEIPKNLAIWVEKGDTVQKGQQLCEGSKNLKELFRVAGKEQVQRYIIKEIQRIYVSQGVKIHDKHIEVILRQMFSRVKIKNAGDSRFVPGEIIEKEKFLEEQELLKKKNKKPIKAKEILLGISNVALTTDSFLSAASFQQTTRVLVKAALEGKEDKLKGLKENVIIGKLIPAGTGFKRIKD